LKRIAVLPPKIAEECRWCFFPEQVYIRVYGIPALRELYSRWPAPPDINESESVNRSAGLTLIGDAGGLLALLNSASFPEQLYNSATCFTAAGDFAKANKLIKEASRGNRRVPAVSGLIVLRLPRSRSTPPFRMRGKGWRSDDAVPDFYVSTAFPEYFSAAAAPARQRAGGGVECERASVSGWLTSRWAVENANRCACRWRPSNAPPNPTKPV
jgi:hypothetical protein